MASRSIHRVIRASFWGILGVFAPLKARAEDAMVRGTIPLLEPIGGEDEIDIGPGLTTWFNYFNSTLPWLYSIAVGLCILWMLYGGFLIMISSDQADKRASGKAKIIGAILGVLVLSFAGTILRILNDLFFD